MNNEIKLSNCAYTCKNKTTRILKDAKPDLEGRSTMETDLKEYVTNKDMPELSLDYRRNWLDSHPGETLTSEDTIHHINGNHNDHRPVNLMKIKTPKHPTIHAEMRKGR